MAMADMADMGVMAMDTHTHRDTMAQAMAAMAATQAHTAPATATATHMATHMVDMAHMVDMVAAMAMATHTLDMVVLTAATAMATHTTRLPSKNWRSNLGCKYEQDGCMVY